jgi:predicted DNA-binding transcriptional regulator AlpA
MHQQDRNAIRREASDSAALEQLLTAREVAALLKVRVKRVYELGLPTVRLSSRSIRYRLSDVLKWIDKRTNTEGK